MHLLDTRFKATGHENVAMPLFIPESLLQKEKDHVEGFAPEVAWVTHGRRREAGRSACACAPPRETLFCDHYAHVIHSYRDLPKLYNQWCCGGALGKDHAPLPAHAWNSCGRRATPCTKPREEAMEETEQHAGRSTLISAKTSWPSR